MYVKFCFNPSQALIFHKNVAFFQRKAFNDQHKNKDNLRNKILIEIGFKQMFFFFAKKGRHFNFKQIIIL